MALLLRQYEHVVFVLPMYVHNILRHEPSAALYSDIVGGEHDGLEIPSNRTEDDNALFSTNLNNGTASSLPSQQQPKATIPPLATWQRRLITHEDPLSIHKLASIGYTITSALLLGTGFIQAFNSDFGTIPLFLEPIIDAFTLSNIIMCVASIRMAFLYRQGDIASRNAFLGTAVSSLFSGFFMVWISPFPMGDIFNNLWISRCSFAILVGLNAIFIFDTLWKQDELIEGRRDRKAEDYEGRILMDRMGYIFPVAFGMPLIAVTGYLASIAHDRFWFLEQCQFIDSTLLGSKGMQSHIFYQQLSTSLGAAYASLFVTLRDKKLISKNQELAGIALFAFPAFVWSMYTTYYFTMSLFMER